MNAAQPPILRVLYGTDPANQKTTRWQQNFRIGRAAECELRIEDPHISRVHLTVSYELGGWWVKDNGSANGMLVNGQRVPSLPITARTAVRLGAEGPWLGFELEPMSSQSMPVAAPLPPEPMSPSLAAIKAPVTTANTQVLKAYTDRYLTSSAGDNGPVGERTMMIRQAFQKVHSKQRRKYGWVVGALGVIIVGVAGLAWFQNKQLSERKALAQDLFYQMKALDVDIANTQKLIVDTSSPSGQAQIKKFQERRQEMSKSYDQFLTKLKVYNASLSEEDRILLRVARIFGECELDMPPEFRDEVMNYVKKWQGSKRYRNAVMTAKEKGYTPVIAEELLNAGLPAQFFYLAMQESDFDALISGPSTYLGYAKGMWQFIPETGVKYGLKMGPLVEFRRPDTGDDRHDWRKATKAASAYLRDLYTTDALASGLLVMASYNWGEKRVIKRIQSMPNNARQRNFWRLLTEYKEDIPKETYDYVFYIVSAAVIGENPRLFGFDFDNPLEHLERK